MIWTNFGTNRNASTRKHVVLRDAGGFLIGWVLLGIPLGIPFDLAWNWLGFRISVRYAGRSFSRGITFIYVIVITGIGLWVDISYINVIWSVDWMARREYFLPEVPFGLQLFSILMPMTLLAAANFGLCLAYLKLPGKTAVRLAVPMAIFTAPWVVLFGPYILGWT